MAWHYLCDSQTSFHYNGSMDQEIKSRLAWVKLYEETGNAGVVCRRCGISRPTLRKWWKRYQEQGLDGLQSESRRPNKSPATKVFEQETQWILNMRRKRKLGVRRIQSELQRLHNFSLSLASIQKVLVQHGESVLSIRRNHRKGRRRYSRPIPGERVRPVS